MGHNRMITGSSESTMRGFRMAARISFDHGSIVDMYPIDNGVIVINSDGDAYSIGDPTELGIEETPTSDWAKLDWAKGVVDITTSYGKPLFIKDNGEVFRITENGLVVADVANASSVVSIGAGENTKSHTIIIDDFGSVYQDAHYATYTISNSNDIPEGTLIKVIR